MGTCMTLDGVVSPEALETQSEPGAATVRWRVSPRGWPAHLCLVEHSSSPDWEVCTRLLEEHPRAGYAPGPGEPLAEV